MLFDKTNRKSTFRNFLHTCILLLLRAEIQENSQTLSPNLRRECTPSLRDIEQFLQIDNVLPFIILDLVAIKLLQGVDAQS